MFVDTHTHFYDEWLRPDAEAAVQRALDAGVGVMIQADVDSHERPAMWEIGDRFPGVIFQMLGFYPGSVTADNWQEELDLVHALAKGAAGAEQATKGAAKAEQAAGAEQATKGVAKAEQAPAGVEQATKGAAGAEQATGAEQAPAGAEQATVARPRFVAIGEIGLDYHEGEQFKEEQKEVLRSQLELAAKLNLPVNIHLRDAWEDLFTILADCRHLHLRGNLHCFTASYEIYERANRYGDFSVGIGGVVTFKNASLAKTLERIPLEKILLETDAPYLAPVPFRGRRNESAYLPYVAAKVAEVKGLTISQIEDITTRNALQLFNLTQSPESNKKPETIQNQGSNKIPGIIQNQGTNKIPEIT